ncbi:MAG: hypothetical protein HYV32_00090 [Candidatus Kerfeldbacteria bacterium]|nr:hypothetical protein [Candidatus Kerfeldbacteria bacterium]
MDLNLNAGDAAVDVLNIALTQNDGATGAVDATAAEILLTGNDADGDVFGLTITGAATTNAAAGTYTGILIDNAENVADTMSDAILVTATGGDTTVTDGLDVSASNIVNGVNLGANVLAMTTGTIGSNGAAVVDFTDFDVDADGLVTFTTDGAGDQLNMTGNNADYQALVATTSTAITNTAGVIDLNITAADAVTQADGATAARDAIGENITLTANDADGDMFGLQITGAATTNAAAGSYTGILIDNAENVADTMSDAILVTATGGDTTVTDGLDVSASNIVNGVNLGANVLAMTTGTIGSNGAAVVDFADFDVDADGQVDLAPDSAGDALSIVTAAGAIEAISVDALTAENTDTDGIVDLDVASQTGGAEGVNVNFDVVDDAGAGEVYQGVYVNMDNNATTADDTVYGVTVETEDGVAVSDAFLFLDNSDTNTTMADGILFNDDGGAITDAIDATDTGIVNALNAATNTIAITTGTIGSNDATVVDFVDFDVSADGITTWAPDAAGDVLTATSAAGDSRILVADATADTTNTSGVIDVNVDAGNAAVDGLNIDMEQADGAAAAVDATAAEILLTGNDADGDMFGLTITGAATTNAAAGSYEAGIVIDNAEETAASMTDGLLIKATTDTATTDGVDVSDAELVNGINLGTNVLAMTTGTIGSNGAAVVDFTDFDVSADGAVVLAPDTAGNALTINFGTADQDDQALVVDAATNDNISTEGVIDLDIDAGNAAVDGISIDMESAGTITAATDITALEITSTATDVDADNFGIVVLSAATAAVVGADDYEAMIKLDNIENTAGVVADAINISNSGGTASAITTGLDFDYDEDNLIEFGANNNAKVGWVAAGFDDENTDHDALVFDATAANDQAFVFQTRDGAANWEMAFGSDISEKENVTVNAAADNALLVISDDTNSNDIFIIKEDGTSIADGALTSTGADLAEYYNSLSGYDYSSGTVVCAAPSKEAIRPCSREYDANVVGIVPTQPGVVMGHGKGDVMVALAGRVPTYFDNRNGEVKPGDLLTTAPNGKAMKQISAGATVGKALENSTGKSSIIVFVAAGWDSPNSLTKEDLSDLAVEEVLFRGNFTVAGDVEFGGKLVVAGDVKVGGNLDVSGALVQEFNGKNLTVGDVVYISGANEVKKALADGSTGPAIGIVAAIEKDGVVKVAVGGTLGGLKNLQVGQTYYLGNDAGKYSVNAPTEAGHIVQTLGVARAKDALLVMPSLDVRYIEVDESPAPAEDAAPAEDPSEVLQPEISAPKVEAQKAPVQQPAPKKQTTEKKNK